MKQNRNKEEDLKLLAKAFFENLEISNFEFGGSSNVSLDMLEIIGREPEESEKELVKI